MVKYADMFSEYGIRDVRKYLVGAVKKYRVAPIPYEPDSAKDVYIAKMVANIQFGIFNGRQKDL